MVFYFSVANKMVTLDMNDGSGFGPMVKGVGTRVLFPIHRAGWYGLLWCNGYSFVALNGLTGTKHWEIETSSIVFSKYWVRWNHLHWNSTNGRKHI